MVPIVMDQVAVIIVRCMYFEHSYTVLMSMIVLVVMIFDAVMIILECYTFSR